LAFSKEEPAAAARIVRDFAKDNDKLVVKVIALNGKLLAPADLTALATMPTREEALGQLLAVMKAPVEKLARTLNEVPGKLVRTLAAVREQKQAA
jgi:large subunit ribosomal protein L10